ncbi:hypothetical protein Q73A0000_03780 [Kaistella flava (ex Peng et al. 2021)]|uniref:Uncharacterized protein n=1 Tax=Kaistella flava (ex Peng et al. 2021) TaxID=2038776 RepID=A0A7M2Y5M7_9FLAO|nr:hypothetical protein [Kaistella flava (ex Peng et al. 2021)]QOW09547.1 hypothetical protein Q73A0000_03780 [Kaistella flava (ex Peng et al. 2021)]
MKEYILKKERVFHFLLLALIAGSMFITDPIQKMFVLVFGILGLLVLSALKKQKILVIVYFVLMIAAGVFYYLMTNGKLNF